MWQFDGLCEMVIRKYKKCDKWWFRNKNIGLKADSEYGNSKKRKSGKIKFA